MPRAAPFRMHAFRLLLPAFAVVVAPLRAQPQPPASDSAIRAIVKDRVDAKLAYGIVVGVLDPDGRRRVFTGGASGSGRALDASTVFEIGSITKAFTGVVLADMVARGEVGLDDPAAKHLPSTVKVPSRAGREITLRDLATHISALPRLPNNMQPAAPRDPYADYTPEQLYAFLASHELRRDVGAEAEYSNLGFMLLGHALARRAGAPSYEALVRSRVLDPLGMDDTRITLAGSLAERLAPGHDAGGEVVANWHFQPTLGGVGALRSTVNDMLDFLAANLAADLDSTRGPLGRVLRASHLPQPGPRSGGLGWVRRPLVGSDTLVWHSGGTGGYVSFAGYHAARRMAVVVLSNSALPVDDIGFHLLAPELALRPPPLPAWATLREVMLPIAALDAYVGEYRLSPASVFTVTRDGPRLAVEIAGEAKRPLYAEKDDEFFIRGVNARVRFQRDTAGRVSALVLRQVGREQVAPKTTP